jgi:hypothetical protein
MVLQVSFAQKRKNIGSEVVNVKPYTAAISCFRYQRLLFLMMRECKKETIKYSIFSFLLLLLLRLQKEKLKGRQGKTRAHLY